MSPQRERVIEVLRRHAPELKAAGVIHLRLFGSVARNEATSTSDIDLMAEFDPLQRISLVTVGGLESHLTELLGSKVDLSSEKWMKEPVRVRALREAVNAF